MIFFWRNKMQFLQGLPAPFNLDWLPFWVFSALGGMVASFIMINDIDEHLRHPFIAKFIIGTCTGMAVVVLMNGQTTPPPTSLAFWAFLGSVCGTPILTGLLVFVSDQKRQHRVYAQLQDKFLPKNKGGNDD